ncbi:MAG: glutamine--fructose-6-phosphate transaminase (isomerizing) [Bdellovibrionia bacterium]
MCGIVGYLGDQSPKEIIVSGLKKLEYRGYDSAGVAILHQGQIKRVRALGKLKALEDKLGGEIFDGKIGIGHTRWATHGAPSERNAHPHTVKGISLVHNGIIENYLEIKEELLKKGAQITSDTDSELVAHLIADAIEETKDLHKAVERTLDHLRGAFSICVMWEKDPSKLVAFKDGPPLVVGIGANESFIASDVQALIQYTNKFVYLEDREVAVIDREKVQYFSANGYPIKKEVVEVKWSPEMVEKQGYAHFMLKEIYEQPRAVAQAIEPHINTESFSISLSGMGVTESELFTDIDRVFVVACGTSFYAGSVAKYIIEQVAKVPVETDIASEFRYRNPVLPPKTLVMTISQSGETADTLAAIRMAKQMRAKTLSICNVKNSSIDREAHAHLYMNSGPEIGVASTKAFTSTLAVLNCVAISLAKVKKQISSEDEKKLVQALLAAPSQMETVLAFDKYFSEASNKLKQYRGFLYLGRGTSFPIAMEGALKLKELAYMHAEGYAAGEMKHGPLALIDERMAIVVIAPTDHLYEKTISNLEEARARGGQIISIGTGENDKLRSISQYYLALPNSHWTTHSLLSVIPLQLMSYHLACTLGYDVDQPRNLAKSVTVE